jgi:hypothetical protein
VELDGGAVEAPVEEALLVAVTELNPPEALAVYVEAAASVLASLGEARGGGAARTSAPDGAAPDVARPGGVS